MDAQKIMSCVYRLRECGRQVGESTIADILHGSSAARIVERGYDSLSTYGIMADSSISHIRHVLSGLISRGLLATERVGSGNYRVVEFTDAAGKWLRSREPMVIQVPKERKPLARAGSGEPGAGASGALLGDEGRELFDRLRALRAKLASGQGVPAYIVFNNKTLEDMCRKRPRTRSEFLEVSGVGEAKASLYADAFLEEINKA